MLIVAQGDDDHGEFWIDLGGGGRCGRRFCGWRRRFCGWRRHFCGWRRHFCARRKEWRRDLRLYSGRIAQDE
jgi:hypothetical protein